MAAKATPTTQKTGTPGWVRVMRQILFWGTWLFMGIILVQALLAGRGIFVPDADFEAHAGLGWPAAHALGPLLLLVSFLCRMGWQNHTLAAAGYVLVAILPILPSLRADQPEIAALHPFVALLSLWLLFYLVVRIRPMAMPARLASARPVPA